jgi:hypothetical protein
VSRQRFRKIFVSRLNAAISKGFEAFIFRALVTTLFSTNQKDVKNSSAGVEEVHGQDDGLQAERKSVSLIFGNKS